MNSNDRYEELWGDGFQAGYDAAEAEEAFSYLAVTSLSPRESGFVHGWNSYVDDSQPILMKEGER